MPPKRQSAQPQARQRRSEVYGILFLAAAAFLSLCLFSYDALDPSFNALSVGKRVHNLGGVVGSYLADLLVSLFGYAAFLFPFASLVLSVAHFAEKGLRVEWTRLISALLLVLFGSVFCHLKFQEVAVGGKLADAGGLIGWVLGGQSVRLFGVVGAYGLVLLGAGLSFLWVTRLRLAPAGRIAGSLLSLASLRLMRYGRIVSARLGRTFARGLEGGTLRLQKVWREWRRRAKPVRITLPGETPPRPVRLRPTASVVPPPAVPSLRQPLPAAGGGLVPSPPPAPAASQTSSVVDQVVPEPKILPRVDLKGGKRQEQLDLIPKRVADYHLPSLSLLDSEEQVAVKIDEESLKLNSRLLERKLVDYDVEGRITEIHPGPVITMYEFEPASGVKVNKIVNLEDDLALVMGGKSVRIIAPIPGKPAVGIEIPNNVRETVWLKEVVGHMKFQRAESRLTFALGKDTEGIPFVADLAKMPHLLVAGATGSGKSVSLNSTIVSILYKSTPEEVRFLMVDLKMLELSIYEGIPHLLLPVVTNPKKAAMALRWAVGEMERRYEQLAKKGVRNLAGYNRQASKEEKMPLIVIVIDELADLMMTTSREVERLITRLGQMARAAGIHLILATQRPSVDVLTGLIKANFPARISFKVSSNHDSRTIIDTVGAQHLLGAGDMLFSSGGTSQLRRIHGAYISETEILRVVDHWKGQGQPKYLDESVLKPIEETQSGVEEDFSDDLYDQAVALVAETRQASISMIQRRLRIGYNRAARMIERMEREGVVGPADGAKAREVFVQQFGSGGA